MYKGKSILGIIPARGESKELPKKNVLALLGKPLIAWTIEQAFLSKYIDKLIVSTDDEEIARISKKYNAETPFIRPKELSGDDAKSIDVIFHAAEWMEKNNMTYDLVLVLQPTSPNRISDDINNAVELLFQKKASSIVSACEVKHHPYLSNTLPKDGCMKKFLRTDAVNKNRQDLPEYFRINGAIYLAYYNYLKHEKSFFGDKTYAYIMPIERSIDIDSELDFRFSEFLLQSNNQKNS